MNANRRHSERRPPWRRCVAPVLLALAAFVALAPEPAHAAMSGDEAAQKITEQFAVKVLRVRAGVVDMKPVWLITVMKEGGNTNDAFQVTTLAVDQETGELVPSFHHGSSGYSLPGVLDRSTRIGQRPEVSRSGPWR